MIQGLSFVLLFVAGLVVTQFAGFILFKIIKPTPLGPLDRILGTALGVSKVIAIFLILSFVLAKLPLNFNNIPVLSESVIMVTANKWTPKIEQYLPERGKRKMKSINEKVDSLIQSPLKQNTINPTELIQLIPDSN